ncbi:trehalose-6-phosphate hydrolase [Clostridioides difficile CD45]|uniref:alpha,alpha-phosphotrehalase n=1 Tax=Clostridioides difficile TaxID=1496 RepID=UPI00038D70FA|nr:alpha,alpha-phosphotrehalase [Clostridioides difficile]EQE59948.1 trehalose-6-phosphate hydrolase [Clostridioides difficile CD45]
MKNWWKKATVYQIYPKSFKDSNNDGIGDINGIIEKLDYLYSLGVDLLWLTPMYVSPQRDNGYDIEDYYNIDPKYGTMNDFEKLLKEAHKRDIKIMMDMVLNHTSTEHKWFKESKKSKDNPYRDYYFWKDAKPDASVPNNWISRFSGTAWKYDETTNQYYLHLFEETQADLNWENEKVREECYKILEFWADKGIDGFRLDVVNLLSKTPGLPDDPITGPKGDGRTHYADGPRIHEYLHNMNQKVFKPKNIVTVGEMSSTTPEECINYTRENREELSMVFSFHHMKTDYKGGAKWTNEMFSLDKLKKAQSDFQYKMYEGKGWNALFYSNHDQPRALSRFGDDRFFRQESAKMLAITLFGLQGTTYIYQGEEIGMTNAYFTKIDEYDDAESKNSYYHMIKSGIDEKEALLILQQKSRDNARTPMQWDNTIYKGFSNHKPWLKVNNDNISVENELNDSRSVFYTYQRLIKYRKQYDIFTEGTYRLLDENHKNLFVYEREYKNQNLLVISNFTHDNVVYKLPETYLNKLNYTILETNYTRDIIENKMEIKPYESIMIYYK